MKQRRISLLFLVLALLAGIVVVGPPLDRLADRSFSWHMVQHLLLLYAVSPLVLLARPFELFKALTAKATTVRFVAAARPFHVMGSPPIALAVFIAALWSTHFSALYEASLEHASLHAAEHALYLVAGITFWLPVLSPSPLRPQSYPVRLLYLALALPQGALLAMAIGAASTPLYPHYLALQSQADALQDQRCAAAVMWIAGGMTIFTAFLLTLGSWARRESGGEPVPV